MTGFGLKESKDEIEKYWPYLNYQKQAMLGNIDRQIDRVNEDASNSHYLKSLDRSQLEAVRKFISEFV